MSNRRMVKAIMEGDAKALERAIEEGADIHASSSRDLMDPLHQDSLQRQDPLELDLHLKIGMPHDEVKDNFPLSLAVSASAWSPIYQTQMLQDGDQIQTPSQEQRNQCVEVLLRHGADPNTDCNLNQSEGGTVLHEALALFYDEKGQAKSSQDELVGLLFQYGADPHFKGSSQHSPFEMAQQGEYSDEAKGILMQNMAQTQSKELSEAINEVQGDTPTPGLEDATSTQKQSRFARKVRSI